MLGTSLSKDEAIILHSYLCDEKFEVLKKVLQAAIGNDVTALCREAQPSVPYDVTVASRERTAGSKARAESILGLREFLETQLDDLSEAGA
jgi:hypothetical protein